MANFNVILNTAGVREMLKSKEMEAICSEQAGMVMGRVGNGYKTDTHTGVNRVNAMVWADSYQAKKDNLDNNTLLKALKG